LIYEVYRSLYKSLFIDNADTLMINSRYTLALYNSVAMLVLRQKSAEYKVLTVIY